jgi:hypothetical protein
VTQAADEPFQRDQDGDVNGKTIRIFLADGEPTGILLGEVSNWTG